MTDPNPVPANPTAGGSYSRCPITGALTPLQEPAAESPALKRHADDAQPIDHAQPIAAAPANAATTTAPDPEA